MSNYNKSALLSFSLFNTLYKQRPKFHMIDIFMPIFAVALEAIFKEKDIISNDQYSSYIMQRIIEDKYKITFPINVITTMFKRAQRLSLPLFTVSDNQSDKIEIDRAACNKISKMADALDNDKNGVSNLVFKFQTFYFENTQKEITDEDAEEIISRFIKQHGYDILSITEDNQKTRKASLSESKDAHRAEIMWCARFVLELKRNSDPSLSTLSDINFGNIIANAVVQHNNSDGIQAKLSNLDVYIDAPILLDVLGISDPERVRASTEFFNILKKEKVNMHIFKHSHKEAVDLLEKSKHWLKPENKFDYRPDRASMTTRYMKNNDKTPFDVDSYIADIDRLSKEYGIKIDSRDYYAQVKNYKYQIDELDMQDKIKKAYQSSRYSSISTVHDGTIDKDIKSISCIAKLRKGEIYYSLKKARYIFITENSTLARVSNNIFKEYYSIRNNEFIPLCLTSAFLCTVVWQQSNHEIVRQLNEHAFLSYCNATITPTKELQAKFMETSEQKMKDGEITPEELETIKVNKSYDDLLSIETNNNIENYGDETFAKVSERFQQQVKAPLEQEIAVQKTKYEELQKHNETLERQIAEERAQKKAIAERRRLLIRMGIYTFIYACIGAACVFVFMRFPSATIIKIITIIVTTILFVPYVKYIITSRKKRHSS